MPILDAAGAARFAEAHYGIEGTAICLPSYEDENYRIEAADGSCYILRIAHAAEHPAALAFQHAVLDHLAAKGVTAPRIVRDRRGRDRVGIPGPDGSRAVRLHTWIEGETLAAAGATPQLLRELGRTLALLDLALADLGPPIPEPVTVWHMPQSARILEHVACVPDDARRGRARGILERFEASVRPRLTGLRGGVIHNDGNGYNVIVRAGGGRARRVVGLTDFGDVLAAPWICEPAIAAAYALLEPPGEPEDAVRAILEGYHGANPLTPAELSLLPDLVEARLAVSVVSSSRLRALDPGNAYISVHEDAAWDVLERLEGTGREAVRGAALACLR